MEHVQSWTQFLLIACAWKIISSENLADLGVFDVKFEISLSNTDVVSTTTQTTESSTTSGSNTATAGTVTNAVSTTSPSTTHPSDDLIYVLQVMLIMEFSRTGGYVAIDKPTLISNSSVGHPVVTYGYNVIYNKTKLNGLGLLHPNSSFIHQLWNVTETISGWPNISGYHVTDETKAAMMDTIDKLNNEFANITWLCYGATCGSGCSQNTSMKVICISKCVEFEEFNHCTKYPQVAGVFLKGTCNIDIGGNAFCDCGMSVGNVMHNFYDGTQCVSVTFIVAMAASAGGFFFLLFLLAVCIICCQNHSTTENKALTSVSNATYNGYNDAYSGMPLEQQSTPSKNNYAYDNREDNDEFRSVRL